MRSNRRRSQRAYASPGGIRRLMFEGLEERTMLTADPQFAIKHPPYLQLGNAPLTGFAGSELDQVEILWQTVPAGAGTQDEFLVEYRAAGDAMWNSAPGSIGTIDTGVEGRVNHFTTLTALEYDSDYEYRVTHTRAGVMVSQYQSPFHTRVAAGASTPFSFAAYGDSASGSPPTAFIAVQQRINVVQPAFSLLLGDNVYQNGSHSEFDLRFDPTINQAATDYIAGHIDYYAMGNHDSHTNDGQPSRDNYSVPVPQSGITSPVDGPLGETPDGNYSWDYGDVHFVTYDSNAWDDPTRLANQLDWILADLAATSALWKVVYAHHPLTSVIGHTEHRPTTDYYQQFLPALRGAGVDLLLAGHSHNYERSYPLIGERCNEATFLQDTDSVYEEGSGLVQVIAGVGGRTLGYGSAVFPSNSYVAKGLSIATNPKSEHGFLKIDVSSTALNVSYIAADDGAVLDSFSIGPDQTGPSSQLADPLDNGPADFDPVSNAVRAVPQSVLGIQLNDFGAGVDDQTVVSAALSLTKDSLPLDEGTDYLFGYNPATNVVSLSSTSSAFADGVYEISLSAGPIGIRDVVGNLQPATTITVTLDSSIDNSQTDLRMVSATSNNFLELTLTYEIDDPVTAELPLQIFQSADTSFGGDTQLAEILLCDAADLTPGVHAKTFTIGSVPGQVPLPGAGRSDISSDYYILAVADALGVVEEDDQDPFNEDNTTVFVGTYHAPASNVYVHTGDSDDVITVATTGSTISLNINGAIANFNAADVKIIQARSHAGNDTLSGSAVSKVVQFWGGTGDDNLAAGTANSRLDGGPGTDVLTGNQGNDVLSGGLGNDRLTGGKGNDTYLFGELPTLAAEIDTLVELANGGTDTLDFSAIPASAPVSANLNNDAPLASHLNRSIQTDAVGQFTNFERVTGGAGDDHLIGNGAGNVLSGRAGIDTLEGNGGNDSLDGGAGDDVLRGGPGNDTYVFDTAATFELDTVFEFSGEGTDALSFASLKPTDGVTVDLTIDGGLALHNNRRVQTGVAGQAEFFENATGGNGNDLLSGNTVANSLIGGKGNDVLHGRDGNDSLNGGVGNDSLYGESGDDSYLFSAASIVETDVIFESIGEGVDVLDFSKLAASIPVTVDLTDNTTIASHPNRSVIHGAGSLAAAFENVIGGAGNDTIIGNEWANRLLGGGGNDGLDGRGGDDFLDGGAGNDTHIGGAGLNTFNYSATSSANDVRVMVAPDSSLRLERRAVGQPTVLETDTYLVGALNLLLLALLGGNDLINVSLDVGIGGTVDGGSGTDTCVAPAFWNKLGCEQ